MHKAPNSESGTLYRNELIFVLLCLDIVGIESILEGKVENPGTAGSGCLPYPSGRPIPPCHYPHILGYDFQADSSFFLFT